MQRLPHDFAPLLVLQRLLSKSRAQAVVVLCALALLTPALATGFALDDYVLALKARADTGIAGLAAEPLWLFTFTTGDPERNQALMDEGVLLPWWTEPRHLNAFFRPLSSLTHVLDFKLWPEQPWLMHLHSLFWYAALLLVLAHVYRSVSAFPRWVSGLALLIYAFDGAHGATVGWIANRNALIAATLALPALAAHHAARSSRSPNQRSSRSAAWLAPLWFALGLCAGESAISVLGYLAAYALCMDKSSLRSRVISLLPFVACVLAHRALYHRLGLGSFGSSAYHDPLHEPLAFVLALATNLPVLLSAQLVAPLADLSFWGSSAVALGLDGFAWLTLAIVAALLWPLLRRDAEARFWALGMLLAAIPVSASVPGERLLLVIGVGAAPLLARVFSIAQTEPPLTAADVSAARKLGFSGLWLLHLVVAPLCLPFFAHAMHDLSSATDRVEASVPASHEVAQQTLIVPNAPLDVMLSYLQLSRQMRGVPRPAHVYWLASASSVSRVTRSSARSLRVELEDGYLRRREETHYRSDVQSLPVGSSVMLSELTATVLELTDDGRPRRVEFAFHDRLDAPGYLWRQYRAGRLVRWQPPALGVTDRFDADDFMHVLLSGISQ